MRTMPSFIAFIVGALISSLPAYAAESEPVHVTVLHASNEGTEFNLENDAYRDQLIKLFSYTNYQQFKTSVVDLKKAEKQTIPLPESYELTLSYRGKDKDRLLVHAVIRRGAQEVVNTILSILRPGVVFVGGPPAGNGVLIIALEAP